MKHKVILGLMILSLLASIILSVTPTPVICTEGCDVVQASEYASIFGIKNSFFGMFIFSFMTILVYSHIQKPTQKKKILINTSIIIGFLVAAYFLYIQIMILNAYCKYCLVVDFSLIISFLLVILDWKE